MTTPSSSPAHNGAERLSGWAWWVLVVLSGALFLDALDVSATPVALPSIRSDLGLSTSSLQWVVSGSVVGFGFGLAYGPLNIAATNGSLRRSRG
jgi:hypothetical protein